MAFWCVQERGAQGLLWSPQSFYLPLFTLAKVLSGVLVWLEGCNTPQWEIYRKGNCKLCVPLFAGPLLTKTIYANVDAGDGKALPDKIRCFQTGCHAELADVLSLQQGQKLLMALCVECKLHQELHFLGAIWKMVEGLLGWSWSI